MTVEFTSLPCPVVRFGPFTLDAARRRLSRDGVPVPLTPKAVDVLAVLISRAGELVAKEDLLAEAWPGTAVEENNLARHVSMLRKAFHDTSGRADYIVTVQGRGYRFVAPLEPSDVPVTAPVVETPVVLPEPAQPPNVPPERAAARWAGLIGLALVVAVAAVGMARGRAGEPVQRVLGQVTYEPGLQLQPAWSPDGERLAYVSDQGGNLDIWVRAIGSPDEHRLTRSTAHDWQPAWSPDGRWLAFRSERDGGGLYLMATDGSGEHRLTTFGYRPQWSPDARAILFSTSAVETPRGAFYVVDAAGGTPRPVLAASLAGDRTAHAAWFPGRDRISMWRLGRQREWTFTTTALDTGKAITSDIPAGIRAAMRDADVALGRFVWSPSGRHLFFAGRSHQVSGVWRVTVDPRTLAWTAGPERLTTGIDDTEFAISADGTRLAFSTQEELTRLWALPLDLETGRLTGAGRPLTSGGAGEYDAAAPIDGKKVAFRRIREGRQEVWEQATDGGSARLLLASRDWRLSSPRWSMDGTRLAFYRRPALPAANGSDATATVIISPDSGRERVVATPPGSTLVPDDWSADDGWIVGACRHTPGEPMGICVLSVAGGEPAWRLVAAARGQDLLSPRFSPDQRWISFMAVDQATLASSAIYVMPAAGGAWVPITSGRAYDDKPRWAPDGKSIYFVSSTGGLSNVMARRFDSAAGRPSGEAFAVTAFDAPSRMLPSLARMEISVASRDLFVPITEARGHVWLLDRVDR